MHTLTVGLGLAIVVACAAGCRSEAPAEQPPAATPAPATAPSATPVARMPGATAIPVALPAGATSAIIEGTVSPGTDAEYVIGLPHGVLLTAHASTAEHDLDVSVHRADTGAALTDETPRNPNFFVATTPATLVYLIVVKAGEQPSPFRLDIEVPRRLELDPAPAAREVSASLPAHGSLAYLTPAGVPVAVDLTTAPAGAYLTVHGLGGKVFLKATDDKRTFSGAPPMPTEGLVVRVEQGETAGNVTLRVSRQ